MPDSKAEDIVLCLHGDLADIESEWKSFERHADRTVFQTFDWLAKYQLHIGAHNGTVPAIVFGRDRYGRLLFILPLAIKPQGPLRRLTWLGSDVCDHNAPLLGALFSELISVRRFDRVWRQVVYRLRSDRRFRFDWIDLQKMPERIGIQGNPLLAVGGRRHASRACSRNGHDTDLSRNDYLVATTIRGRLAVALVSPFRRIKRFIKEMRLKRYTSSRARAPALQTRKQIAGERR